MDRLAAFLGLVCLQLFLVYFIRLMVGIRTPFDIAITVLLIAFGLLMWYITNKTQKPPR